MPSREPTQLSLPVSLRDEATFDNFIATCDSARQALSTLMSALPPDHCPEQLLIWGASAAGLTHFLQAACRLALESSVRSQYLPLASLCDEPPQEVFDDLEHNVLICIDDLDSIVGLRPWEEALFHFYNKAKSRGAILLMSAHTSPSSLTIQLNDLKSRLMSSIVFHIDSMTDSDKKKALMARAKDRGMALSPGLAEFILNRVSRNPSSIFDLLDDLDRHSLQAQRRLTIPFVKSIIDKNHDMP